MAERKPINKCYYEVLGIDKDATDEMIRKSYRSLALKYHPDKNIDNAVEATEMFRSVQVAYEVLIDPRERAWYDKHRTAILSGVDKDRISDSCFDVFPYFSASCYSGYDDSPESFYSVYKKVIEEIIKEDMPYMDEDDKLPPRFGDASTPYEEVHAFYGFWESYSTPRTFDHLDEYETLRAPNRRVNRLMEKENKKIRDAARKKRNEEIRTLISFIKRRDKRVEAHKKLVEIKLKENRKKSAEHRKKQLQDRWKEADAYRESDLFSVADLEEELKNIEERCEDIKKKKNGGTESEKDEEMSELYCLACEKLFKSVKSFANHENSKKHKTNLALLKTLLEAEDDQLANGTDATD